MTGNKNLTIQVYQFSKDFASSNVLIEASERLIWETNN
jgi:hypothetical protein